MTEASWLDSVMKKLVNVKEIIHSILQSLTKTPDSTYSVSFTAFKECVKFFIFSSISGEIIAPLLKIALLKKRFIVGKNFQDSECFKNFRNKNGFMELFQIFDLKSLIKWHVIPYLIIGATISIIKTIRRVKKMINFKISCPVQFKFGEIIRCIKC